MAVQEPSVTSMKQAENFFDAQFEDFHPLDYRIRILSLALEFDRVFKEGQESQKAFDLMDKIRQQVQETK